MAGVETEALLEPSETVKWTWRHYCFFVSHFVYYAGTVTGTFVGRQFLYERIRQKHINNDEVYFNLTRKELEEVSLCCNGTNTSAYQLQQTIQAEAASWNEYFSLVTGLTSAVPIFFSGSLCDVLGRKSVAVVSMAGSLARHCFYLAVAVWKMEVAYLVVGYVAEGCTGAYLTHKIAVYAYSADIMREKKVRTSGLVFINSLCTILTGMSSLGTGLFIKADGYFLPLLTVCLLVFTSLLVMALLAEETRSGGKLSDLSLQIIASRMLNFYTHKKSNNRWKFWIILAVFVWISQPRLGIETITTLYMLNSPFCWSSVKVGLYNAIGSMTQPVLAAATVMVTQQYLTQELIASLGCLSYMAMFLLQGFSDTEWMLYVALLIGSLGKSSLTIILAIASHLSGADEQGAVMASLGTVEAVCSITSVVMLNSVYAATLYWMKGFVFVLSSTLFLVPASLLLVLEIGGRRKGKKEEESKSKSLIQQEDGKHQRCHIDK